MTRHEIRLTPRLRGRLGGAGLAVLGMLGIGIAARAAAQVPSPTVRWTAVAHAKTSVERGGVVTLELSGQVAAGWHVYALTQAPGGPTPLRVALDANDFARLAGTASGTAPKHKFDPSFGLDTQFYSGSFTLHLPVRVAPRSAADGRSIPVSVRFQTCNGRVCEPPKTIHLSVPIAVSPEA